MESNPYEPIAMGEDDAWPGRVHGFEDGCLLLKDQTALPNRCVVTGEELCGSFSNTRKLQLSAWRDWKVRSCKIRYSLSEIPRRKYQLIRISVATLRFSIGLSLITLYLFQRSWLEQQLWWLLILSALCSIFVGVIPVDPIKIVGYEDGLFRIAGCKESFLEQTGLVQEKGHEQSSPQVAGVHRNLPTP